MRKGDVNWTEFGKEFLRRMVVYSKNEDSGYDIMTDGRDAGDIGRWRFSSAVHPSMYRGLTWKELALELGLFRGQLTSDGHDCRKCPNRNDCLAYFKDDEDHEACGWWRDANGVPVPSDEPYGEDAKPARKKVWKARHKATGLFYKPGASGPLDPEGKTYTTRSTIMTFLRDKFSQTVCIYKSMPAYRKYAGIYEALAASGGDKYVSKDDMFIYRMSGSDFELVEYGVEYKEIGVVKTERYE